MSKLSLKAVRQTLVGVGNLKTLLSDRIAQVDPYSNSCPELITEIYDVEAQHGWGRIKHLFVGIDITTALENTWAVVAHMPDVTAFLHRGVELDPDKSVLARAKQLAKFAQQGWAEDQLTKQISLCRNNKGQSFIPDLLHIEGIAAAVRVRFGLAHRVNQKSSVASLLKATASVNGLLASQSALALNEAIAHRKQKNKLSFADLSRLAEKDVMILAADRKLLKKLMPFPVKLHQDALAEIELIRSKYAENFSAISQLKNHIDQLDWSSAEAAVLPLVLDYNSTAAATDVLLLAQQEQAQSASKSDEIHTKLWIPMTLDALKKINQIFNTKIINESCTFSANDIAQKIIDRACKPQLFNNQERRLLNQSWSSEIQKSLIEAKCYGAFDNSAPVWSTAPIPALINAATQRGDEGVDLLLLQSIWLDDPELVLETLTRIRASESKLVIKAAIEKIYFQRPKGVLYKTPGYQKDALGLGLLTKYVEPAPGNEDSTVWYWWVAAALGTPAWRKAVTKGLVKPATLEQILYAAENVNKSKALKKGFKYDVQRVLSMNPEIEPKTIIKFTDWLQNNRKALEYVAPLLPSNLFKGIMAAKDEHCHFEFLQAIYPIVPSAYRLELWQRQLDRVETAKILSDLLIDGMRCGYQIGWSHRWQNVNGPLQQKVSALVLAARKDPSRLKKLKSRYGEKIVCEGLRASAKILPENCRWDVMLMELTAAAGIHHGPTLQWLLAQRNRQVDTGCRLDHLYTQYEIPKKSGKMRTIFVPQDGLKRVQRAILHKLLNPLGFHQSACGFALNKSIVDNASPHVNQAVVVNADVSNCFPSVCWPLVLAALKRDLRLSLSAKSISALVDICTAGGALPIGAPTSPALLNRILFKTDQILTEQAAKRGCGYTRYADDLTFSGGESAVSMLGLAKRVLKNIGLELDPVKTNIYRRGRRQMCTGLVVNEKVSVPRHLRRKVRAAVHALEMGKILHWDGAVSSRSALQGRLSFMNMVNPKITKPLIDRFEQVD